MIKKVFITALVAFGLFAASAYYPAVHHQAFIVQGYIITFFYLIMAAVLVLTWKAV